MIIKGRRYASLMSRPPPKKIYSKRRKIRDDDNEKCHLICFINFHGLLGHWGMLGGVGVKLVFFRDT
jgi:hypothetical protein